MRLRNTANGAVINVDDELGNSLLGGGWKSAEEVDVPDGEPSESWKVAELVAYAKAHSIEITGDARRKSDVLEAIEKAKQGDGSNPGA
ncbi:DUF7302 family protein [Williamsia serinedens]|uniref:DUF2188 domain-containing protein n=1 Tax=Williamsia serinedens TaxID=391736 RepID=A0ABT1H5Z9_9NOCA|nr:hypothetical protein [Williamsia serinedens]MCP2162665.1 hypothetical protein [Williamsia serinedens]